MDSALQASDSADSRRAAGVKPTPAKLVVFLIGNYVHDAQQSMQRFAAVMEKELKAAGCDVRLVRPEPFFGRLHPGATGIGKWLGYLDKFVVFPRQLKRLIRSARAEGKGDVVVHICDHSNAFYTHQLSGVPCLVTCHDLLAVRSALGEIPQNPTRWSGRRLQGMVLSGLTNAPIIACVSEATHRDLCRLVPRAESRSRVLRMGLNNAFHQVPSAEAESRVRELMKAAGRPVSTRPRCIVHVGGEQWYKNRPGVVELFCELRRSSDQRDLWLMMVGKPLSAELTDLVRAQDLQDRVVELPGLSHEDLCAVYSAAELFLFPSLMEGFGWPVIEAQACGCRVVTTDRPPMNDVGGDGAAFLVPEDIRASIDAMLNVLYEDEGQRLARVGRGFANVARYSTGQMIENYLLLYRDVVETQSRGAPADRR